MWKCQTGFGHPGQIWPLTVGIGLSNLVAIWAKLQTYLLPITMVFKCRTIHKLESFSMFFYVNVSSNYTFKWSLHFKNLAWFLMKCFHKWHIWRIFFRYSIYLKCHICHKEVIYTLFVCLIHPFFYINKSFLTNVTF